MKDYTCNPIACSFSIHAMPKDAYSRDFFVREGHKGGKSVDPEKRKAAASQRAEIKLAELCAEEGFDYATLPTDDENGGKKLLPDVVRNKYLKWRYGWDPSKDEHPRQGFRKVKTNDRKTKSKK